MIISEEEAKAAGEDQSAPVDFEAWAVALCTLLDKIELLVLNSEYTDDMAEVGELSRQRHDIAREHGLDVVFDGIGSGRIDH